MKKGLIRGIVLALASVVVMSFASPALAYAEWPNADWNQKTFGLIKQGEKNVGKCILVQWHCYAAKATTKKGTVMPKTHVDGILGSRSIQYVKSYQLKKGLRADGKVGNATYDAMKKTLATTGDPSKGYLIYDTHDVLNVPKTSRHTKAGHWFTYNRNGIDANII